MRADVNCKQSPSSFSALPLDISIMDEMLVLNGFMVNLLFTNCGHCGPIEIQLIEQGEYR